jgi:excisionase family DNA binding protein
MTGRRLAIFLGITRAQRGRSPMSLHLTVQEAATTVGISPRAVRARLQRCELRGVKVANQWKVRREDLPLTAEARYGLARRGPSRRRARVPRPGDDLVPAHGRGRA